MQKVNMRSALHAVKLTTRQKEIFSEYLVGQMSSRETAKRLGITTQRIYTMSNSMLRHMAVTGRLNTKEFLANF